MDVEARVLELVAAAPRAEGRSYAQLLSVLTREGRAERTRLDVALERLLATNRIRRLGTTYVPSSSLPTLEPIEIEEPAAPPTPLPVMNEAPVAGAADTTEGMMNTASSIEKRVCAACSEEKRIDLFPPAGRGRSKTCASCMVGLSPKRRSSKRTPAKSRPAKPSRQRAKHLAAVPAARTIAAPAVLHFTDGVRIGTPVTTPSGILQLTVYVDLSDEQLDEIHAERKRSVGERMTAAARARKAA